MDNNPLKARLELAMELHGLKGRPTAVARGAGVPLHTVKNILKGVSRNTNPKDIARLAFFFNVDSRWLRGEIDEQGVAAPVDGRPEYLPIRHRVEAGAWRERVDEDVEQDFDDGPALPPDIYSTMPQWWEKVEGESIDELYPAGALLRVIDAAVLRYKPRDHDLVVVERRRNGQYERTAKLVTLKRGRVIVAGASSNPRWNQSLDITEGKIDDDDAAIVGLVTGAYIERRR